MQDPIVQGMIARLEPVLAEVRAAADQADDMFWAQFNAPKGAVAGTALVFAEALGYLVCWMAEGFAAERGLSRKAQRAVRFHVLQHVGRYTFLKLPTFDPAKDSHRVFLDYLRVPSVRADPMKYIVRRYAAAVDDRVFLGRGGNKVRRAARFALEVTLTWIHGHVRQALG